MFFSRVYEISSIIKVKLLTIFILSSLFNNHTYAVFNGQVGSESSFTMEISRYVITFRGCTLARISKKYFLGAAHCLSTRGEWFESNERKEINYKIKYGFDGLSEVSVNSFRTNAYLEWSGLASELKKTSSDLMVFEFKTNTESFLDKVEIASVNLHQVPWQGQEVIISGYGGYAEELLGEGRRGSPVYRPIEDGYLRTAKQKITNISNHTIGLNFYNEDDYEVRLAKGDSGGPCFNDNLEIIGVNSSIDRVNELSVISRIDLNSKVEHLTKTPSDWLQNYLD